MPSQCEITAYSQAGPAKLALPVEPASSASPAPGPASCPAEKESMCPDFDQIASPERSAAEAAAFKCAAAGLGPARNGVPDHT